MESLDSNTAAWLEAIRTPSARKYGDARRLLPPDQDLNVRGIGGITALHIAAQREPNKMLLRLLHDGADHTVQDDKGRTPLQIAQRVHCDDWSLVFHDKLVCSLTEKLGKKPKPTEISAAMKHNRMARFRNEVYQRLATCRVTFRDAAWQGNLDAVRCMVESGQHSIDTLGGGEAFSAALAANHLHVGKYLMACGAHTYSPCYLHPGRNAPQSTLVTAVQVGDASFVRQLVTYGASVFEPKFDSNTCALAEAVKRGSIEMIETLLELGIRPVPGRNGVESPLPVNEVLDFESSNVEDETPWWLLAMACWFRDHKLVEHLFSAHATLNDRELMAELGARALVLAVYNQDEPIVADLLGRGAGANEEVKPGLTAISAAEAVSAASMLRILSVHRVNEPMAKREGPLTKRVCNFMALRRWIGPLELDQVLSSPKRVSPMSTWNEAFRKTCGGDGNTATIPIYLAHGIKINYSSWNTYLSPLLQAILGVYPSLDVARLLLENGAHPMMNGINGKSVSAVVEDKLEYTSCARQRTHLEAARQLLIEFGASRF